MATAAQTPTPIRLFEIAGKVVLIKEPWLDAWAKTRACDNGRALLQKWLEDEYLAYLNHERWRGIKLATASADDVKPPGRFRGRFSPADRERIHEQHDAGETVKQIAKRWNISETTIRRALDCD